MISTPSARSRAQSHFKSSESRQDILRAEAERERAATDAKTARLRELRLSKEAEDKAVADRLAAGKATEKGRKTAKKAAGTAGRGEA